ncbi:MAG: glycosyltransferase [Bacteroidaceae bacterium]|nr:glycosyltransferase [Bacteroidaceae bacterium]
MHILELPSFFSPHGGLFCLEQAKALKAFGHDVRIVSVVELGVKIDREFYLTASWREERREMEGVECFNYYMRAVPKMVRYNVRHWISLCEKAVEKYVLRYGKPDVLHAHCCKSAGLAAKEISQRLDIPYFITEHIPSGFFERDFGRGWQRQGWLKERMRQAYEAATCVVPVSRELVDDLAPYFGTAYHYHPVSNVIDTDFFAFRERKSFDNRPFIFCCPAVADIYRKGYDVLAEAISYLPAGIELHIVGQGTDSRPMRDLFAQKPNVYFHGGQDKHGVRDLLWKSDALVLPSRSEAQPLVILEALATGIPVVTTECVPLSLRIPGACLIAPIGNARALAGKMQDVMHIAPSREFSDVVQRLASPSVVAKQLTDIFLSSNKE